MKKILVAAALALVASQASARIANSRHDFQTNGYVTPLPTSACVFCHTPHNAVSAVAPIWARQLLAPTVYYTSSTVNALNNTSVSAAGVNTCLGCHATGTAAAMGTTSAITNAALLTGTDLSNDHPVGNDTLFGGASINTLPITLGSATFSNATDSLSCAGCHDVHNTNAKPGFALIRNYTGDFCAVCHNK